MYVEVLDISVEGHLTISTYVAVDCYSETGKVGNSLFSLTITFPFSVTRNKFIGIGCKTFAFIEDHNSNSIEKNYHTGWLSLCTSNGRVSNGSCSGSGYCKPLSQKGCITIMQELKAYITGHTGIWGFNPCSILFWWKKTLIYDFSTADLVELRNSSKIPTVLDWG